MSESEENSILETPAGTETQDGEVGGTENEGNPASKRERWILFVIAAIIILLDQGSKYIVKSTLELYTYYAPIPELENFFRITHITNTGVAFGLFPNGNLLFTIVALIVSVAIIIYNSRLEPGNRLLRLALGLQLGGAMGNLIDRLQQGSVTDFMDFGPWPVWNIADLAVVSGTILLVLIMYLEERREKELSAGESDPEGQTKGHSKATVQQFDESSTS